MNKLYRQELVRLGFPVPVVTCYLVRCEWRPPKDHWPLLGARPRNVDVLLNDTGGHHSAAIEACLFLIAHHRGKATARSVLTPDTPTKPIDDVCFDWSWYDGVVTYGAEVVQVIWE